MAGKYMKNCLASLVIREMEMKATLRFHLISVRVAIIKQTHASEDMGKDEHLDSAGAHAI